MSAPVLVLRPQPAAARSAERLRALDLSPILYPLFAVEPLPWTPPDPAGFDAVLLTSANAARLGGGGMARYFDLPAFAVGEASARAARAAGFRWVRIGGGDAASTVPLVAIAGHSRLLHLCGDSVRPYDPCGLTVEQRPVYRTVPLGDADGLAACLPPAGPMAALIHSPRAGARLHGLAAPFDRARIAIAAISAAAAAACGQGWRGMAVAARPQEDALLRSVQTLV